MGDGIRTPENYLLGFFSKLTMIFYQPGDSNLFFCLALEIDEQKIHWMAQG